MPWCNLTRPAFKCIFLPYFSIFFVFFSPALKGLVMSDELHKAVAFEDCDSYELFSTADRFAFCRVVSFAPLLLRAGRSLFLGC